MGQQWSGNRACKALHKDLPTPVLAKMKALINFNNKKSDDRMITTEHPSQLISLAHTVREKQLEKKCREKITRTHTHTYAYKWILTLVVV